MTLSGFRVLRRKYFSLRDNPAGLASSLAPRLDPMARRVRRIAESGGMRLAKGYRLSRAYGGGSALHAGRSRGAQRIHRHD